MHNRKTKKKKKRKKLKLCAPELKQAYCWKLMFQGMPGIYLTNLIMGIA